MVCQDVAWFKTFFPDEISVNDVGNVTFDHGLSLEFHVNNLENTDLF